MSDDHSQNNDAPSSKKGFFSLLLSQLFHGEPKNRDELLGLIRDSEQKELIDQDTRDMLEGVLDIAEQRVRDIMIPRSQMITLKRNQSLEECLAVIIESAHSRFPVISEDKDHVEGILMAKDLLPFMSSSAEPFSMVFIFADHREARVGRFNNHRQALFKALVALQGYHLRARDHNVAHALFGNIQHPFQHVAGVLVDQLFLLRIAD